MTTDPATPLLLRALAGEDTARAPVWLMRQAGRYLPEYRALKEKHTFWEMARTPELACEITLQPIRRLGMDAAILFQDIMTPLPAMGIDIEFAPGPVIASPLRTAAQIEALRVPEVQEIAPFVPEAIRLITPACPVPLIGFGGAPLTLATYLIEGSGSKEYGRFRGFLRAEPALADALLEKLTAVSERYLTSQVEAGAQAIQIFDSWAGIHSVETWTHFGLPWHQRLVRHVQSLGVPVIYLAVDSHHLWPAMAGMGADAWSVDWRYPLHQARQELGGRAIQGNLDPAVFAGPLEGVAPAVESVLCDGMGGAHVFNLGHGMLPFVDPGHVQRCVETVQAFDRRTGARA
jgi:uroporphyrinogen decarboxylase